MLEGTVLRRIEVGPGISDGELVAIAPGALDDRRMVLTDLTPEGRKAYGLAH